MKALSAGATSLQVSNPLSTCPSSCVSVRALHLAAHPVRHARRQLAFRNHGFRQPPRPTTGKRSRGCHSILARTDHPLTTTVRVRGWSVQALE